jgi:hypothetical protein
MIKIILVISLLVILLGTVGFVLSLCKAASKEPPKKPYGELDEQDLTDRWG